MHSGPSHSYLTGPHIMCHRVDLPCADGFRRAPDNRDIPDMARRPLSVGIGLRQDTTVEQIEWAVRAALGARSLDEISVLATLDAKAEHPALAKFSESHRIPLVAFAAAAIEACFDDHPTLHRSSAALTHIGVEGVCEPCALLASRGGTLLVGKHARDGVTIAIAAMAETHTHNESAEKIR